MKTTQIATKAIMGLGAVLGATHAQSAVVSNNTVTTIKAGQSKTLVAGVTLANTQTKSSYEYENDKYKDVYTSAIKLTSNTGFVTSAIGAGTVIGPNLASSSAGSEVLYSATLGKDGNKGAYTTGSTGTALYGFSFVNGGVTNYGWASITVSDNGKKSSSKYESIVASLNSFAYTDAGEHILAGTTTTTAAVPEAETIAMLAAGLGLVGMVSRRRRTQKQGS